MRVGKDVSDEQPCHAAEKLVPLLTFKDGKDVKDEHFFHVPAKNIPCDVSIVGKDTSSFQLDQ